MSGGAGSASMGGNGPSLDAGTRDGEAEPVRADASADAGQEQPNPLGCDLLERDDCNALLAALVHRYSFDGTGTAVVDSVGVAHGSVQQAQLTGTGAVNLSGDGDYVDLPNGIVSALSSGTFEVWLEWAGGDDWQRIFDFGISDEGEEGPGSGEEYISLIPSADSQALRLVFRSDLDGSEVQLDADVALPEAVESHVAVVVDGEAGTMALFLNGELLGSEAIPADLSAIDDVNNWLGLSQFDEDPSLEGSLLEFRIYAAALTPGQIELSFERGADAPLSP